jgi:hypothetical protein
LADPPEVPDDAGTYRPRFSAEDFAAFTDARIAALKSGLQLKPTQEKKWFALETASTTARCAKGFSRLTEVGTRKLPSATA